MQVVRVQLSLVRPTIQPIAEPARREDVEEPRPRHDTRPSTAMATTAARAAETVSTAKVTSSDLPAQARNGVGPDLSADAIALLKLVTDHTSVANPTVRCSTLGAKLKEILPVCVSPTAQSVRSQGLATAPPASVTFTDREADVSILRLNAKGHLSWHSGGKCYLSHITRLCISDNTIIAPENSALRAVLVDPPAGARRVRLMNDVMRMAKRAGVVVRRF